MAEASTFAARIAAYSTTLTDLLVQADELKVAEEDRVLIRTLLLELASLSYSQALRTQLHATKQRRNIALEALHLERGFNSFAVDRIPREGPFLFGGKLLDAVDSDLVMNKRAMEVAAKVKSQTRGSQPFRRGSFRRIRGGRATYTVPTFARGSSFRARGRGGSGRASTGGRGRSRAAFTASNPTYTNQRK